MKYTIFLLSLLFSFKGNYTIKPTTLSEEKIDFFAPTLFENGIIYSAVETKIKNSCPTETTTLYYSEIIKGEILGKPKKIKIKNAAAFPKGVGAFDYCPATSEVYFTALNPYAEGENASIKLALFVGKMDELTIKNVTMLSFCDPNFSFAHSTISSDGKTLILSSNKTSGEQELYTSFRTSVEDNWSEPVIIEELASNSLTLFPKLLNDSLLVFSSSRPGGKGGADLYTSKKENGHWNTPMNWHELNGKKDDIGLDILDETSGYLSADRTETIMNERSQIFYFKIDK
ncbi:MAG: hypothetical protein MUC59_08250 [Saprospiraceae bacterium]|nr:hypothetical protein [Saprospiraceae bacterium]